METVRAGEVVVRRVGVTVEVLGGDTGVDEAIELLDRAEADIGAPLVDEAERSRLHALVEARGDAASHWHPLLATAEGAPTGYAGIVLPDSADGEASSDLAPDRRATSCDLTVTALFAGLAEIARRHGVRVIVVWIRHATGSDEACARSEGFEVERRLSVMGRAPGGVLGDVPEPDLPDEVTVRSFRDEDEDHVVAVLHEAYEGTPDGGWDHDRFRERRAYDWFDRSDLLVADDGRGIAGIHWTKRRGDRVGEVYNLAVADRARGTGLGRALLRAGLRHLRDRGCDDVILWVDRANEPAVGLYASEGFAERWVDVAFQRDLA